MKEKDDFERAIEHWFILNAINIFGMMYVYYVATLTKSMEHPIYSFCLFLASEAVTGWVLLYVIGVEEKFRHEHKYDFITADGLSEEDKVYVDLDDENYDIKDLI